MKWPGDLMTEQHINEGDVNGYTIYEILLSNGTRIYADPHLTENHLRFDKPFSWGGMVSIFAFTEGAGISQMFVNLAHIISVKPMEVEG